MFLLCIHSDVGQLFCDPGVDFVPFGVDWNGLLCYYHFHGRWECCFILGSALF